MWFRHELDIIEQWRHTRLILAYLSGVDARKIIELPGDYDHLVAHSKEEVYEMARKFGVAEKWGLKPEC